MSKNKLIFAGGLCLIGAAVVFWTLFLLTPVLHVSAKTKGTIAMSSLVVAEISFWLGSILVGKEIIAKYKQRFSRSLSRGKSSPPDNPTTND